MNWNKLSDIGGTMNKKKRIEEIRLARLRELLIEAIRERSGKVVALPSPSVMPMVIKNILILFLMILTVFIFLFALPSFAIWFQELITHPFKFLQEQIEFNPFFRTELCLLMIIFVFSLWERKAFKAEQAQILRRAKEEVLEWQNFADEELPNSVKELKQYLSGNEDVFNNEELREPGIKSLLRLFHRNVSQEDITELRQQLVTILSEKQQDTSKLPKGAPFNFVSFIRIVLLYVCGGPTLYIIWSLIASYYYDAMIALIFFGLPIGMYWMFYFEISSSVHEKRKRAVDKLLEIARAEIATYKDVAIEDVPEQIKQLQRFIEILESKYHMSGDAK